MDQDPFMGDWRDLPDFVLHDLMNMGVNVAPQPAPPAPQQRDDEHSPPLGEQVESGAASQLDDEVEHEKILEMGRMLMRRSPKIQSTEGLVQL